MEIRGLNLALIIIAMVAIALLFIPAALPKGTFPNSSPAIIWWSGSLSVIAFVIPMYFCFKR